MTLYNLIELNNFEKKYERYIFKMWLINLQVNENIKIFPTKCGINTSEVVH